MVTIICTELFPDIFYIPTFLSVKYPPPPNLAQMITSMRGCVARNDGGRGDGYPNVSRSRSTISSHDDVIKWKHFPLYWPFVRGIHRSPVTGEFPSQRPVTRSFCVFFYLHLNKRLSKQSRRRWFRRHRAHYDVSVMSTQRLAHRHLL